MTGCPFGMSGNKRQKTGLSQRERALISPLFPDFHYSEPKGQDTGESEGNLECCFRRVESRIDNLREYLGIAEEQEFADGNYESNHKERNPDII